MKRLVVLALSLLLGPMAISAAAPTPATATGWEALALAAVVAQYSASLSPQDKKVLEGLFDGNLNVSFPAGHKISVKADAVVCRASNVDITARSCGLTFGTKKPALKGRQANEVYATMVQAGVPLDGAAGTVFASVSHLVCTIDPNEIKQKDGGGANCTFDPGQP